MDETADGFLILARRRFFNQVGRRPKAGIHIEAEAEAEAFTEGVVTAVNQLQYITRHSVTERRH